MRLICPNCGAQYEVADDVIPASGRDVQCSNCAHTWYETPGASEAREAGETPVSVVPDPTTENVDDPQEGSEIDVTKPEPESFSDDADPIDTAGDAAPDPVDVSPDEEPTEPETDEDPGNNATDFDESSDTAAAATTPQRRPLSPSVADILRQEAAREEARRKADGETGLESQPDLGLDRPLDRDEQLAEEARRRMARLKGEAAPAIGAETAVAVGARGEMLPDIEEINSSLRTEIERSGTTSAPAQTAAVQRKSGFRRGFLTVVLLALLGLLLYILAPQISSAVPALEPALTSYVDMVNQARLWLDLQLQSMLPGDA